MQWSGGFSRRSCEQPATEVAAPNHALSWYGPTIGRRIAHVERTFYDPLGATTTWRNRLPHWQQAGATYFVTFRLADSIPQEELRQLQKDRNIWLRFNPKPWTARQEAEYSRRFGARIEHWLDKLHGSCALRLAPSRRILVEALMRFNGDRYQQHSWVVMPNHVHVLFSLEKQGTLETILQNWKGSSARAINYCCGTRGNFWQKDYFDRLIRTEEHFWRCVRYIRQNSARLASGDYVLWESEEIQRQLDN